VPESAVADRRDAGVSPAREVRNLDAAGISRRPLRRAGDLASSALKAQMAFKAMRGMFESFCCGGRCPRA
jgi:hypothetical protein